jgi:hypothetical protein
MRLFPDNPHYVEFRGKPTLLVGSGEHYGAVLNLDFEYIPYLDRLAQDGLNLVRIFSGTYRELPGEFGILHNTLAPQQAKFISPWPENDAGKFDLSRMNVAYLARLRDFIRQASDRGIVVELCLFCFWYSPRLWEASPMHPAHTLQGVGPMDKERVYQLADNDLLPYHESLVRSLVTALNEFDNVYFEVCNEPYSRHDHTAYLDWQHHIVDVITGTEDHLPNRHLVAINYQNRTQRIPFHHPSVSICNFHYAVPDAVKENYHHGCLLADDETGFVGQIAAPYRREAWNFMLSGGGAFSHLDYSFTCEHPDGSARIEGNTPGYGGPDLRQQLGMLRRFLEEHEIWKMVPYHEMFAWNAGRIQAEVMCIPNQLYLVYFAQNWPGNTQLLALPGGKYELEYFNPISGQGFSKQVFDHPGVYYRLDLPNHNDDLVMRLRKIKE